MSETVEIPREEPTEVKVLEIWMTKEGQVKVMGALVNDRVASCGVLSVAMAAVHKLHDEQAVKIHKPGGIINFVRGNGKR